MPDDFTMDPIRELIELCESLDPPLSVSMDPQDLNPPAGWIALDEVRAANLAGGITLRTSLYLIAPDVDPERSLTQLVPIFQQLRAAGVKPDGPVTTIGVVLPGDPTPLPALRVPIDLTT